MDGRASPQLSRLELVATIAAAVTTTTTAAAAAAAAIATKPRIGLPATLIKRDRQFLPSISTFPYHPLGRIARLARRVRTRWPRSTERSRSRLPYPASAPEHKVLEPTANTATVLAFTAAAVSDGVDKDHYQRAPGPRPSTRRVRPRSRRTSAGC